MRLAVFVLLLVAIIYLLFTRGGFLSGVTFEGTRGSKLAQLMSYHFLRAIYGHMLSAVMHSDGAAHEFGEDGRRTRPGFYYLFIGRIHLSFYSIQQPFFYVRSFLTLLLIIHLN